MSNPPPSDGRERSDPQAFFRELADKLSRKPTGAHSVAARSGRGEWSVLLVLQGPNGSIRRSLSPEEAEVLAADLLRNAKLARDPGGMP